MKNNNNLGIYGRVAKNIRFFRQRFNLTLEELSDLCDLSPSFIGTIERCHRKPSLKTLEKIAAAMNLDVEDLITGSVPNPPVKIEKIIEKQIINFIKKFSEKEKKKLLKILKELYGLKKK